MSGNMITSSIDAADSFNPSDNFRESPRPEHHIHRESEPLPMGQSTAHGFDQPGDRSLLEGRRDVGVTGSHRGAPEFQDQSFQRAQQDSFDSDRPLNVQPISQGGVAIDRDGDLPDLPEGQANKTDKIIGKIQKVTGKYMNKPELQEKGELRETGGKLAVNEARASHV